MSIPTITNLSGTGAPKPGETGVVWQGGSQVGTGTTGGSGEVKTPQGTYHPTPR